MLRSQKIETSNKIITWGQELWQETTNGQLRRLLDQPPEDLLSKSVWTFYGLFIKKLRANLKSILIIVVFFLGGEEVYFLFVAQRVGGCIWDQFKILIKIIPRRYTWKKIQTKLLSWFCGSVANMHCCLLKLNYFLITFWLLPKYGNPLNHIWLMELAAVYCYVITNNNDNKKFTFSFPIHPITFQSCHKCGIACAKGAPLLRNCQLFMS